MRRPSLSRRRACMNPPAVSLRTYLRAGHYVSPVSALCYSQHFSTTVRHIPRLSQYPVHLYLHLCFSICLLAFLLVIHFFLPSEASMTRTIEPACRPKSFQVVWFIFCLGWRATLRQSPRCVFFSYYTKFILVCDVAIKCSNYFRTVSREAPWNILCSLSPFL